MDRQTWAGPVDAGQRPVKPERVKPKEPKRRWSNKGFSEELRKLQKPGDNCFLLDCKVIHNIIMHVGLQGKVTCRRDEENGVRGVRVWRFRE